MPRVPQPFDERFDPIMQRHREDMQATMSALVDAFPGVGLCLFLFDQHAGEPRANFISNADPAPLLAAIKQWVARQEAALPPQS